MRNAAKLVLVLVATMVGANCSGAGERGGEAAEARASAAGQGKDKDTPAGPAAGPAMVFERQAEAKEGAFTVLVPRGWRAEGGMVRVDPSAAGGPANAIAAKIDFAVKKDPAGSVMIRWLPDQLYFDARRSPAGQMGLFPPGSIYQGMVVRPLLSAEQFLAEVALAEVHHGPAAPRVTERRSLPELARSYGQRTEALLARSLGFSFDAATVTATGEEGGLRYKEMLLGVVQDWGAMGAGMWGNRETILVRAPEAEFERWLPVLRTIQGSVRIAPRWLAGELKGQAERGQIALRSQEDIERIGREIAEHHQKTNAEIQNDMYLTLTGQEEYVNPHTNEVERDTGQWKHRWVSDSGDVVFSDREDYDPNLDLDLNRQGFKRSEVRKRFPQ